MTANIWPVMRTCDGGFPVVSAAVARPAIQEPAGALARNFARAVACRVIDRVAQDRFYIGHTLDACMRRFDLDEDELAASLACPLANLASLALYPRPDPRTPGYSDVLDGIAARTGADARALRSILELTEPMIGVTYAAGAGACTADAAIALSRR